MTRSALLEPDFLRTLEALRRRLVSQARSGLSGEATAPRRGSSTEFREHRAYAPGDDPRRMDWLAFARTGQPVIKQFYAEEDAVLRLLLDASASLGFGEPTKLETARRLAAALAYLALSGGQRAELWVARDNGETSVRRRTEARRGRGSFASVCRDLAGVEAYGRTNLSRAVDQVMKRTRRPGMLVVLSDFFDPGAVPDALGRAASAGHDVVLVQVLDERELAPDLDGDFLLEDAETGKHLEVTADPQALKAYAERLAGLMEELRRLSRRRGMVYTRLASSEGLEEAVRRVLTRSID